MSRLRMGIVGAGGRGVAAFGQTFAGRLAGEAELTAFADVNALRARAAADWLGVKADVHETAEELAARADIDAIVVTSPDCFHEQHAIAALNAGKHVFVDKPLATTVSGCLNVIEAARRAGSLLYMGFNLRHHAVIRRMKEVAKSGAVGDIFSIHATEHYNGGRTYHSRWNRLKQFTGGLFIHKGSHDFDVINYIMGDVRPARVSCFASVFTLNRQGIPFALRPGEDPGPTCSDCPYGGTCPDAYMVTPEPDSLVGRLFNAQTAEIDGYHKNLCMYASDKDTHDQGVAIVEYENGATAMHSECFVTPLSNRRYLVDGTRGHFEADMHANQVTVRPRWSNDVVEHRIDPGGGSHGGADPVMIRHFLDCVRTGERPTANAVDGTWSVAVGVAAELSRAERRVVEIGELLDPTSELLV